MAGSVKIVSDIYLVGGPDLTDPRDALSYLIVSGREMTLVDCGARAELYRHPRQYPLHWKRSATDKILIATHRHPCAYRPHRWADPTEKKLPHTKNRAHCPGRAGNRIARYGLHRRRLVWPVLGRCFRRRGFT